MPTLDPADPVSEEFRHAVGAAISEFLNQRAAALADLGADLDPVIKLARAFTTGGKRLRPAFCCWGYVAATGDTDIPASVVTAAASLDLLHVGVLMHDDVMDGSNTRRGIPSAHIQFAQQHAVEHRNGNADDYGRAEAILLGDLLVVWSAQLLAESGAPNLAAAAPLAASVREEVNAGQVLDTTAQTRSPLDARTDLASVLAQIERVVEYKTARYTVIRPLQIGAALGGGSPELLDALARFGSPLGRAFQFRDDVLGVFGEEAVTGKPAGDDLREGKLTVLIAQAMARADQAAADQLNAFLGTPLSSDQVDLARRIIVDSGALAATEAAITAASNSAAECVHAVPGPAQPALTELLRLATQRTF